MSEIDKIDLEIVKMLMQDGRIPAAEIARRVGAALQASISERMVRYRIERMRREGLISISAIMHPRPFGFQVVADVFIEVEPAQIQEVAERLAALECVSYVACSIGERDVSAQVVVRSNQEVYAFATEVIGKMPGVRKTTTSIVPIVLKDVYQWRIPDEQCIDAQDEQA
jgi:Lrp/AsnC family transcriptional regulator for asnA, asnC and gidA